VATKYFIKTRFLGPHSRLIALQPQVKPDRECVLSTYLPLRYPPCD